MLQIDLHQGPRDELAPLFAEADDSESEIASYCELGELLVARDGGTIVGLALVLDQAEEGSFELKSLAVDEAWRSRGIGAALVAAVAEECRRRDGHRLLVATAAASIGALQFYQRQGFRFRRIVRDFYSAERGYRPMELNGIPLLDEVILDLELRA
jgi:ribosomal protein S18 acetylase RimI-like enzyme